MNAEQIIKANLDGKFFFVDQHSGRTMMKSVGVDHIPEHKPIFGNDFSALSVALAEIKAKSWLPEEDEKLIAMRARGMKWESIRKIMQRGERSIKERYLKICGERGIEALLTSSSSAPMLTSEAKREIVALRSQGHSFGEIAELTGRPAYQVLDYFNRYMASKKKLEHY
jgi:hypothetical protein